MRDKFGRYMFHFLMVIRHIILRSKVINNRGSLKQIMIEKVSVLVNNDFS